MSIIKHFGTNLFNSGNIYKIINDILRRLNIIESTPSGGDGNGIYDGSGVIPVTTLATITTDPLGNGLDFAIGEFPNWPDLNLDDTERGFFYGKEYWEGLGLVYESSRIEVFDQSVLMRAGTATGDVRIDLTSGKISISTGGPTTSLHVGSGSPNGTVIASPGALYLNTTGGAGTTLYIKESGAGTNTGWVGK